MTTQFTVTSDRLQAPVTDDDHSIGPATAPVTLVEYGDYQCLYCGMAHPLVQELLRQRADTLRYVYRHFPFVSVHPYAETAAETAEAAGVRGRFWHMHEWLFEHQDRINPVHLVDGIADVGPLVDEVVEEVDNQVYRDRVQRDFVSGVRSGVNGTPTFFVNGRRHSGGYSLAELLDAVDLAAAATRHDETGTPARRTA
jgi:protein-disulfide isomerase